MRKVIFLDRDGTINRDSPDYIKCWAEFEFLPGSLEALALLYQRGFDLILITNQSSINRGMVSLTELWNIHQHMRESVLAAGGRIRDIYFCPHRPDERCDCRKPQPGLIRRACARHGIHPADSYMIGDSARDIICGRNAGCGSTILVMTGNGKIAQRELADQRAGADMEATDLLQAAHWIISRSQSIPEGL